MTIREKRALELYKKITKDLTAQISGRLFQLETCSMNLVTEVYTFFGWDGHDPFLAVKVEYDSNDSRTAKAELMFLTKDVRINTCIAWLFDYFDDNLGSVLDRVEV